MNFKCPLEPRPSWCSEECQKIDPDDPQKQYLYCFEESLAEHIKDTKLISLAECKELVESICTEYGVPVPEVKDGRGLKTARGGFNKDGKLRVKLPCQYRYRIAVLHEAAHCIFQYLTREESNHQHHGPAYVKYLLEIYSKRLPVTLSHLHYVARMFSLDF